MRRRGVDVGPGHEGLDQAGVLGQVGDHPQLDLVVVGHQKPASRGRHEALPEATPFFAADRDVVQVGLVRAEPSRPGHGLVEGGVDPPVGRHFRQQRLAVGRTQLLDLPVTQERIDDRVLAPKLLEGLGVGGEPRLGPLLGGQAELDKEDLA
jgi:hypothetical protein